MLDDRHRIETMIWDVERGLERKIEALAERLRQAERRVSELEGEAQRLKEELSYGQ